MGIRRTFQVLTCIASLAAACGDDDDDEVVQDTGASIDASTDGPEDGMPDSGAPMDASVDAPGDSGSGDAGDGSMLEMCERADMAFRAFLAAHQACSADDECAIIGDCSPNADFKAIRSDAAEEGYALMRARCGSAHDGPVYTAYCDDGTCASRVAEETATFGCPQSLTR